MDVVTDTTGLELSQAFSAQARFSAPSAINTFPPIPEESTTPMEHPTNTTTDPDASDSEENLYSSLPYPSPPNSPSIPPDPRNERQTE